MTRKKKGTAGPPKGPKGASKAKGHPKFAPRGPRNEQSSSFTLAPSPHKPVLTLADEARNTERSPSFWNSDQKLRGKQIVFVSAGHLHGEQPKGIEDTSDLNGDEDPDAAAGSSTPNVAMAKMTLQSDSSSSPDTPHSHPETQTPVDDTQVEMEDASLPSFFVDTVGERAVATGLFSPVARASSPTPSDSSEEVVLFKGRNNINNSATSSSAQTHPSSRAPQQISSNPQSKLSKSDVIEPLPTLTKLDDKTAEHHSPGVKGRPKPGSDREELPSNLLRNHALDTPSWDVGSTPWEHKSTPGVGWLEGRQKRPKRVYDPDAADNAALEDYMANIRRQQQIGEFEGFEYSAFANRPLALDDGDNWKVEEQEKITEKTVVRETTSVTFVRETAIVEVEKDSDQDEWDSVMLEDFDDISTSSDVIGTVERIVAKRERRNGFQYLVIYEGHITSDARWLPSSFLTSPRDFDLIWAFEAKLQEKEELQRQALESSDSELDSSDDDNDEDDFQDEKDLIARRVERMTDEQIARRLQEIEELGLGSGSDPLFEDDDAMDDDIEQEEKEWMKKSVLASAGSSSRFRQKGKRARGDFPSASLMADVLEQDPYGGFDIMDTERPSLKKKSKGRRGQFPAEISDSDLEAQLRSTWEADRRKKSEYKKNREERRAQGLLGKKNESKVNLSIKYKDGFSMVDMLEEIREFLISDNQQSRALPPMEAHERAHLHRFAKKLELTTKSVGSGQDRFINISKNTRTRPYDEDEFNNIMFRFRFLHAPKGVKKPGRIKATTRPIVSYRDGDVVGASAPELGAENKGHALLQKMGWSKGMALGALDNKGILQPIAHTVKSGKAGLK